MKNIWKRFFALTEGQDFYIRRNKLAVKVGFCLYREHDALIGGPGWFVRIAPWRRVRTTQPIKARPFYDAKSENKPEGVNYPIKGTETGRRITATECRESMASQPDFHYHGAEISPAVLARDPKDYQTHYVGDDCPGGHRDTAAEQTQAKAESTAAACPIALAVARELTASEIQDRENTNRILAEANAQPCECEIYQTCARCSPRDPMAQDHSPDKPSVAPTDRNGPSS